MSNGMRRPATQQEMAAQMHAQRMLAEQEARPQRRPPRVPAWSGVLGGVYLNGVVKVSDETMLLSLMASFKQPDDSVETADLNLFGPLELAEKCAPLLGRRVVVTMKLGLVEAVEVCE